MTKKVFLAAALAVLAAGVASAQVTISGGFALSYMNTTATFEDGSGDTFDGDIGLGGNLYVDYLLPVSVPLSLGVEGGVDTSTAKGGMHEIEVMVIPLLLRAAYHFDINPKLDLYLVGKIGGAFGHVKGMGLDADLTGFGFGVDLGAAFYFTPIVGLFAEGGFDGYMLQGDVSGAFEDQYGRYPFKLNLEVPFYRFLTVGLSVKF